MSLGALTSEELGCDGGVPAWAWAVCVGLAVMGAVGVAAAVLCFYRSRRTAAGKKVGSRDY